MTAAHGLITVFGAGWWLLNATTGALITPQGIPLPPGLAERPVRRLLPLSIRSVVVVENSVAADIDPVTAAVRWRATLPGLGYAVIGNVLYTTNVGCCSPRTTAILRIDLASGQALWPSYGPLVLVDRPAGDFAASYPRRR